VNFSFNFYGSEHAHKWKDYHGHVNQLWKFFCIYFKAFINAEVFFMKSKVFSTPSY
jgi:hypothetical protein